MTEVEKKESQKTVVAFISGLLIGGLLVWVFSSTPDDKKEPLEEKATTEVATTETTKTTTETTLTQVADVVGEGSVVVRDQKAGNSVALESTKLPTKSGWVVVRDYMDGVPGNVLGAARYSADEGLTPTRVELMRNTVAGSSYQVVFFTNAGDAGFSISEDVAIGGITTTFKAN